jgi:flagellar M-ring protein FliF
MPDKARAFLKQLSDFWASLPTVKRFALVFFTAASLVAVIAISVLSSREHYAYLYTELSVDDAAQMVEKLKTGQVPYQLQNNGTAIEVPEDRVAALRLEFAAGGLPRGGSVGFEIFDRSRIGATEFEQQVNLRRALEGELVRSVMSIDGVKAARVHLVLPEHRLFAAREESASASVVVKLANSANFGKREVAAVVHLVSMAVPGLSKDRISVVSTEGLTLHRPNSDAGGGSDSSDRDTEQSRALGSQLEADTQAQLERVVGPGNADVRVNVELNESSRERTEELYDPSKTALRSEHKTEETSGAADNGVAGVPGAKSNLPDAQDGKAADDTAPTAGGGIRKTETRNWEVQRITQKTTMPPGDIKRLSVAVVLNGRYERHGEQSTFVPRTPEEVAALEGIVKHVVGFDATRGDDVEVRAVQFARLDTDEAPQTVDRLTQVRRWLPVGIAGLVAVIVLCALVLVWRQRRASVKALQARTLQAQLSGATLAGSAMPLGSAEDARALLADESALAAEARVHALEFAAKDPATAAVVLRRWLSAETPELAPTPAE